MESTVESAKIVDEYNNFYYYGLWMIIARTISYYNHTGPSGPDVATERLQELQTGDEEFIKRYQKLSDWIDQYGTRLPSLPDELPPVAIEADPASSQEETNVDTQVDISYEALSGDIDLKEDPEDIDLDDLMAEDDRDKPLSELIVQERSES